MADINGDKKLDLVVSDGVGEIWTFYGKGTGVFTAGPVYPVQYWEQAPDNMILADFNGDGVLDIFKPLESETWDGQVILGRSDGTFQTNAAYGWTMTTAMAATWSPPISTATVSRIWRTRDARSANLTQPGFEVMLGSSAWSIGSADLRARGPDQLRRVDGVDRHGRCERRW